MLFNNNLLNILNKLNLIEYIEKIKLLNNQYELKDFESNNNIDINKFKSFYENNKIEFDKFINEYIEYYNLNIKLYKNEINFTKIKTDFLQKYINIIQYLKKYELLNINNN